MNKLTTTLFLLLAILFEVAGTTAMKMSAGFSYLLPSIFIFVFYFFSLVFLALTLKRLEVTYAYAIWSGLGTLLLAVIGTVFFAETMTLLRAGSLGFIILGVVGLRLI